jgi:signal transduction histidine kinase/DNA-binding response OmpR family regulator
VVYVRDIFRDHTGLVWIATWTEGVFRFDPKTKELTNYFRNDKGMYNGMTRNLYEDRSGVLWLGTRGGLNRYDRTRDTFVRYERKLGDPNSMSENTAFDIYEDEQGYLWIGTYGGGLNRFDPETETFRHFTIADGLPSNNVFSIQPDRKGKMWFSTDRGIASYDPKKETFEAFDRRDGLLNKSYNAFSYYQSPYSGHLFYEGEDGLDIFHPDSIQKDLTPPRIAFTDLLLYNQSVPIARTAAELSSKDTFYLAQSITETKQLTLPYAQKVITFEFAALHYLNPSKNQYAYKLEGFDRDWQYIGAQRTATFTNLSPGAYTFMVKAANSHGFWNDEPATIQLVITPPWWQTWPAYFLYGLLIGLAFYAYYRYQRRQWRLQTQLALEQEEARRLKEMDETKTRLYTNITHEFRTPLTVISGMAEQIGKEPEKWLRKGTEMIRRNSEHLVELINQVLDLRKLESNKMPAQFIQGDIVDYLRYLSESHESLAANRDIDLDFSSDTPQILMDYDPEKLRRILSNLLSNAVKFTPAGGRVRVQVSRRDEAGRAHLQMAVSDTGAGIPPEKLPYIFDRFYQADDSATRRAEGTGIGLALVRELVKLLGGAIAVDSREGEGSVFTVRLPIHNRAPHKPVAETTAEKMAPAVFTPALQGETIAAEAFLSDESERPTLLIIEDNPDVQQYLFTILESGYDLLTAADGQAGIDQALEHVPDIIISDIMMPVKDGFEVCRTLKEDERTSHIPIILLTARADRDSRLEGLERGADAYLPKPFYPEELQIRLRKLVELREKMRRRYAAMEPLPPTTDPDVRKEDEFILRARAFVEQNIGNAELSLHDLCRELAVSRTQLHNKLKALSGRSTTAFIRIIRLQHARKLLAETDLNVSEVAYAVGFNDPNYFSRRYFEAFGVRPGEGRSA